MNSSTTVKRKRFLPHKKSKRKTKKDTASSKISPALSRSSPVPKKQTIGAVVSPSPVTNKRQLLPFTRTPSLVNDTESAATLSANYPVLLAPTIEGVHDAARFMKQNCNVLLPTETVYVSFKVQAPDARPTGIIGTGPLFVFVKSVSSLSWCWPSPKPYALRKTSLSDSNASAGPIKPVWLCEAQEVLKTLALRLWPGPIPFHVRLGKDVQGKLTNLPEKLLSELPVVRADDEAMADEDDRFVGIQCHSHPLMARVMREVQHDKDSSIVVGHPTSFTRAEDAVKHQQDSSSMSPHYVLNGEDQRELFAVPTCQYETPSPVSLWIDDTTRTVFIVGSKSENTKHPELTESSVQRALWAVSSPPSPTTTTCAVVSESSSQKQRVIAGVLRKWSVVDKRC